MVTWTAKQAENGSRLGANGKYRIKESAVRKTFSSILLAVAVLLPPLFCTAGPEATAAKPDTTELPTVLQDYVAKADPTFAWKINERTDSEQGRVFRGELTSQTWHGIVWKHTLNIHEPKKLENPRHVLLVVWGGTQKQSGEKESIRYGLKMANLTGARVAIVHQVPNQPLLGNHVEDDLITETYLRYMADGDKSWPLLFPMTKSAVRAMDAVEAIAQQEWQGRIDGFVVTGGSKRGWTSWLTGVVDKRVLGIAPAVADVLNVKKHMQRQLETWGHFSEKLHDYTSKKIIHAGPETPAETELRTYCDPYTYRSLLTMPKLVLNGTNDPYWAIDATQLYWYDLVGPKYLLKLPNAGHGLETSRGMVENTLAVFFRRTIAGCPLPTLQWKQSEQGDELRLRIESTEKATLGRLWYAHSPTLDFRTARWQSQPLEEVGTVYLAKGPKPKEGHVAFFGELQFESDRLPYSLTSLVWTY
jgi:PhoPQ-activated pathogenicity-related protein